MTEKQHRQTQADRILAFLKVRADWVPAYYLPGMALSYTRRIHELRKRGIVEGFSIEIQKKRVGSQLRTAYRFVAKDSIGE